MPTHKILISDTLSQKGVDYLRQHADVSDRAGITPEDLLKEIPAYHALIVRGRTKVTQAVFEAGANLEVVGRAGVGVDNIDLQAAQAAGVAVVNSPTATTDAVAEHALALMLALARDLTRADATMKAGRWEKKNLQGTELGGKTLGIIGMGRIGTKVAHIAQAFGMAILGCDPLISDADVQARGATPRCLEDTLTQADIITVHVPMLPETRGLIDEKAIARMKPGVVLISTARGGIIEEAALLKGLQSGHVARAALDVFEQEPPGLTELVAHPNLIATPHIAAQTAEAQERAACLIAEEIIRTLEGEPLRWKIV
jgi:D-3-phosphoglycerate dehydrogenase